MTTYPHSMRVPLTYQDRVIGGAVLLEDGTVECTIDSSPLGVKIQDAIRDDVLKYLSVDSIIAPATPQSNLVDHARRELEILGEEADTVKGYLNVVQAFADMGHSGASAACAIPVLERLLQFKNLKPLTNDPKEWNYIAAGDFGNDDGIWQNNRNSEAFSNDGGKTYYLLSEGGNNGHREPLHTSEQA